MGKVFETITPELQEWIAAQKMFFVATAPLSSDGLVNLSPKGMDSLRILDENTVAYIDLTGSGVETIAHIKENQRVTIMWCAFEGPPKILRVYGTGSVIEATDPRFSELAKSFPSYASARAVIIIKSIRIADSCGFGVPEMQYEKDRDTLVIWGDKKGEAGIVDYQKEKNLKSLDGLPGLDLQ